MRRIVVAMSGGIDSAVSAHLVKLQNVPAASCSLTDGWQRNAVVEAVFMNNWDGRDDDLPGQCSLDSDFDSALATCRTLSIPLHRVSFLKQYWSRVFEVSLEAYRSGMETPNPDILCNREIKFGELLQWSRAEGFDALVTGHYTRKAVFMGKDVLMQAKDLGKDQTYFLSQVPSDALQRALFPTGDYLKTEIRSMAASLGWDWVLRRKESMGICFVGRRRDFGSFLQQYLPDEEPGPMVMLDTGRVVGQHTGLSKLTIGQNARVHSMTSKLYVASKKGNAVYLVDSLDHPALHSTKLAITSSNWLVSGSEHERNLFCSIRSQDKLGAPVSRIKDGVVLLEKPVFAPAPGQYAVLYKHTSMGSLCIGSGKLRAF